MKTTYTPQMGGLVWVVLGVALCLASINLGLGTLHKPGSGLTPFLTGGLVALLGLVLITYKTFLEQPKKNGSNTEISAKKFWKKRVYSLIALFMYAFLLEPIGFIPASFLLLFSLFKIMEPRKWLTPIFISIVTVILSYLIFWVWLRIHFPEGILRIG